MGTADGARTHRQKFSLDFEGPARYPSPSLKVRRATSAVFLPERSFQRGDSCRVAIIIVPLAPFRQFFPLGFPLEIHLPRLIGSRVGDAQPERPLDLCNVITWLSEAKREE
jgi:hypothetical protein